MLVAVLMIFVIFSYTGVAVLNVSYLSQSSSMETVENIKLQYAVESEVNEALWRINSGADSLVSLSADGITTTWDSTTNILSVNVDMFEMESEILLDLSEDTHFDRGIAAEEDINLNGYTATLDEDQRTRESFTFLPDIDIDYFTENADYTHGPGHYHDNHFANGTHVFNGDDIHLRDITLDSGVLVFTGRWVRLDGVTINSGTIVITGKDVSFEDEIIITAPEADSTGASPAIIFSHEEQNAYLFDHDNSIMGAIYCKGNVHLWDGEYSGPVVGKNVSLHKNFDFDNVNHKSKFQWTKGFGKKKKYDWPKQIGKWKTKKWGKKHHKHA